MLTLFLVTTIVPLLFGLWAQMKVKRTFAKYSQIQPRNGMNGAEAAAAVLRSSGLPNLKIRPVAGRLTDHYDPRNRTLNLSADVGQARADPGRRIEAVRRLDERRLLLDHPLEQPHADPAGIGDRRIGLVGQQARRT